MVKALWRGLKARARKSQSAAMGWLPRTATASAAQHRSLEAGRPEDGAHSRRPLPAPPLAVVGITAGAGNSAWAYGALFLFLSSVVAILIAGVAVFVGIGYRRQAIEASPRLRSEQVVSRASG
jgi:hypothetical protein